jgi:hypothetical protein
MTVALVWRPYIKTATDQDSTALPFPPVVVEAETYLNGGPLYETKSMTVAFGRLVLTLTSTTVLFTT